MGKPRLKAHRDHDPSLRDFADEAITLQRHLDWRERRLKSALADLGQVVYFIRSGPFIKIGTSVALNRRRSELRAELTDILAVVPGGREVEQQMLDRFTASLAKGDEWFHPTDDLIGYINEIRERLGVAAIIQPTKGTLP